MGPSSKQQTRENARPLVEAYKRTQFDRIREELSATLNADDKTVQKVEFLASVQVKVLHKLKEDERRGLPDRSEDDAVEYLLRDLDRFPIFDSLLEHLFDKPELMQNLKNELRSILIAQLGDECEVNEVRVHST